LLSTRFTLGSTRDEVIAAQGYPPTYSTRNARTLWWGSAKVMFSADGYVTGWTDGIPSLMIRR
jgi:hypothetical protein